jgi:4'-phosphopantetheinyl transferase EntD
MGGLSIAFALPMARGLCIGVELPEEVPENTPGFHPDEWNAVADRRGVRRRTWLGGRFALREALRQMGGPTDQPLGSSPRGAPLLPSGYVGSVSHKSTLAVALVVPAQGDERVGVDVEELERPRLHLAPRILTPNELRALQQLPEPERWPELLLRFSAKEALYKAIDPFVQRYVGFLEVAIERGQGSGLGVRELAEADLRELEARGEWQEVPGHLVTSFTVTRRR